MSQRKALGLILPLICCAAMLFAKESPLTESERAAVATAKRFIYLIDHPDKKVPNPRRRLREMMPLPLVTVSALSSDERRSVMAFASGSLQKFSSSVYASARDFDAATANLALDAGSTFHSSLISEGFNRLGNLGSNVRINKQEVELIDAKDRLNDVLHLWGLHLVLDVEKLNTGRLNLSAYTIEKKHGYDVLGSTFVMYEVQPIVENEFHPALGHAEVEQGYLLLFGQTVDSEVAMATRYLETESVSFLAPGVSFSSGTVRALDALTRDAIADTKDLRARFIDTVGHHEGFHKYIEPTLAMAVKRGFLTETEKMAWHETGAYLYQLESSDERFTLIDLMVILATARSDNKGFYANKQGARQMFAALQRQMMGVRFVGVANNFSEPGLIDLFTKSSAEIKQAAFAARQHYEIEMRNGLKE